jgi:uncharacterized membrane-anchored protein
MLGESCSSAAGLSIARTMVVIPAAAAAAMMRAIAAARVPYHGGRCSRTGLHAPIDAPSTARTGA